MAGITAAQLKAIAGAGARSDLVAAIVRGWPNAAAKAQLTTRLRAAHFLAQIMTETGGLAILEESGAYRAARIMEIFAGHPHADQPERSRKGVQCLWHGSREELPALHRALVAADVEVVSFAVRADDLEDLYMRLSRHETA